MLSKLYPLVPADLIKTIKNLSNKSKKKKCFEHFHQGGSYAWCSCPNYEYKEDHLIDNKSDPNIMQESDRKGKVDG